MNVGIFIGGDGPQSGGGHAFVRAVIEGLRDVRTSHSLRVLHSGFSDIPHVEGVQVVRVAESRPRSLARKVLDRLQPATNREVERDREISAELDGLGLHLLWFLTPATLPTRLPYAVTVWDLAHRVEPEFPEVRTTGWSWDAREAHYRKWLPRAAYVIIGAAAGRDDIARCYGVSPGRIRVLPLVAPARDTIAGKLPPQVTTPYLFYPAQFWPHKNHVGLLLALREVRDRHSLDLKLVLTGSDKGNLDYVRREAQRLGLSGHVTFTGFVSDAELTALYANATALVFPSFFGPDNLPPLEAMQLGCPVIAANVPGVAEQLGDAALLIDPRNSGEIARAIVRICSEPALRGTLVARGKERAAGWQPADYVRALLRTVDEFETERRCWSLDSEYVHS